MSEDTSNTGQPDGGATNSTADAVDEGAYFRAEIRKLSKERDEFKARTRELEKAGKATAAEGADALAKAGQWEQAATKYKAELDSVRSSLDELEALRAEKADRVEKMQAEADKLLAKLPKDDRELVPAGLDPESSIKLIAGLLEKNTTKKGAAPAPAPSAAPGGTLDPLKIADPAQRRQALAEMGHGERSSLIASLWRSAHRG